MQQKKLDTIWVPNDSIIVNTWNPNKQTEFIYEKTRESLLEFGFLDAIKVRSLESGEKEIIDGEHRWKLMQEILPSVELRGKRYFYVDKRDGDDKLYPVPKQFAEGLIPIIDYGTLSDSVARELTVILNNTRGEPDKVELAKLISELNDMVGVDRREQILPFPADEQKGLLDMLEFMAKMNKEGEAQDPWEFWEGMPAFQQDDKGPFRTINVHFQTSEDVDEFTRLVGQEITDKTKYIWFPKLEHKKYGFVDDES